MRAFQGKTPEAGGHAMWQYPQRQRFPGTGRRVKCCFIKVGNGCSHARVSRLGCLEGWPLIELLAGMLRAIF